MAIRVCLAITFGLLGMDSISFGTAMKFAVCENNYPWRSFDIDFVVRRPECNKSDLLLIWFCLVNVCWPAKVSFQSNREPISCGCLKSVYFTTSPTWVAENKKWEVYELGNSPNEDDTDSFLRLTIQSACSSNFNFVVWADNPVFQVVCNSSTTEASRPSPTTVSKKSPDFNTGLIVGIVVGVGGAAILVTAILLFIFIRRRREKPNQLTNPAVTEQNDLSPRENAYTKLTPALPVFVPYDNAPGQAETTSTATTECNATYDNANGVGNNAID